MATVKKTAGKKTTAGKKASAKKTAAKTSGADTCWPGYEHTPGTTAGEKGSCRPEPGEHSKATKKATRKTAAAAKLGKPGKRHSK